VEEPPATATLGQLYLQQGHRDEARKIFHRVLERDPAHPVALAALQAMDKEDRLESEPETESSPEIVPPETPVPSSEDGWLTAAALLQGSEAAAARGLTARKALVLNNYLARLRAGEQGA
jgi:predicted Zn-dependent protease